MARWPRFVPVALGVLTILSMSIATPQRAQGYEKELAGLAASISEAIEKAGKTSVAVVDFSDLQGSVTELGRFMAEELSVRLNYVR